MTIVASLVCDTSMEFWQQSRIGSLEHSHSCNGLPRYKLLSQLLVGIQPLPPT